MRVLIAHANEKTRAKLADVVTRGRRLSLDLVTAGNGPDVLDLLLAEDPPEVALIDWDLPGIEAPEMCRLVRDFHHHHDTWIIVLTPRAHQESASEVWSAGADDCVYTPAPAKLLSDRVTKGLCEMSQPVCEAAARVDGSALAAQAGRTLGAPPFPAATGRSAGGAGLGRPAFAPRPSLEAVSRRDEESPDDGFAGLTADLKATASLDDPDAEGPAELAAGPAQLSARRADAGEADDTPRGPVKLEAGLARL